MILQQASSVTGVATSNGRRWRALLTGTALGCSLLTAPALAQVIERDTVVTTGDDAPAIYLPSQGTDPITIISGSITTDGANSHAILVGPAEGIGYGSRPANPDGGTGVLTIVSDSITISGNSYAIAVDHRGPISIDSGTIEATGDGFGPGIYVYGVDTIDIKSQSINTPNGTGIIVYGDVGDVTIDSGIVAVGEGSDSGVFAQTSTGNISIKAAQTSTLVPDLRYYASGNAVYGFSQSGNIEIESGSATTVGISAIGVGGATTGAISIKSTEVSTQGMDAWGVYARGTNGGVTVDSVDVQTAGAGAYGIHTRAGAGTTIVTSTGTVETGGEGAHGIYAVGIAEASGAMDITSAAISVSGDNASAIRAENGSGDIVIRSGTAVASGNGAPTILATATTGDILIESADASATGTEFTGGDWTNDAIVGISAEGSVTINSGNARSDALYGSAVAGVGASVSITSDHAITTGNQGAAVIARTQSGSTGDAAIVSNLVEVSGNGSAIEAFSAGGRAIVQSGSISSGGSGIRAEGLLGADVTAGSISSVRTAITLLSGQGDVTLKTTGAIASDRYGVYVGEAGEAKINVEAESSITGGAIGIFAEGATLDLTNAGVIRGNGTYDGFDEAPHAGITLAQGDARIVNTGTISGAGFGITTAYYWNPATQGIEPRATGTSIENSGTITGETNDAIRLIGGGSIVNSGTIEGLVGDLTDGISAFALEGQDTSNSAIIVSVDNALGGTISGTRYGLAMTGGADIENAGTISGGTAAVMVQAQSFETGKTATIANSGTMTGNSGVRLQNYLASATITNGGLIEGTAEYGIFANSPGSTLTLANIAGGEIVGAKSGIFAEGSKLDLTNAGVIRGNGTYDGFDEAPHAGITLAQGDARIVNTGTISGAGFGITTAYYWNPATQGLEPRATGTLIDNSGTIRGDNNDAIRLIGGGTIDNKGMIEGVAGEFTDGISMFELSGQDTTGLAVLGSVTNRLGATISGSRMGIILSGGGDIDNAGTISGGVSGVLIQTQTDTQAGKSAILDNSGAISGASGVRILGSIDTTEIRNSGEITGSVDQGVYMSRGGTLENSGTITGAQNDAVLIHGFGSVVNSGTIKGVAGASTDGVQLQYYPGVDSGVAEIGSVVNEANGTITGARYGIILAGGGTIENAGTITGGTTGVVLVNQNFDGKTGSLVNSGTINGGAFIALSSGTAMNTGTIVNQKGTGFVSYGVTSLTNGGNGKITGRDEGEDGLGEAVSMTVGYDQSGNYTGEAEAVSFDNSGTIEGEVSLELITANLSFKNSGLILGTPGDSVIDLEVATEDGGAGRTVTFDNSGQIRGSIETELYAANVSFTNNGSILAVADEGEGEPALDIENYTWASQQISFTNAAGGSIVSNGVRASGLLIEAGAGLIAPENEGDQPTVSDDLSIKVAISAMNQGRISANDGGEVEDVTEWEIPGVDSFVTFATGVGISALAPTSEASLTNGADGVIEATGETSMAVYANAGQFTLTNAGRISGGTGTAINDRMMDGGDLYVVRDVLAAGGSYVAGAIQTVNSVDAIVNSGTIEGSISLMAGNDSLTNSGTINGAIDFGTGDDLLVLRTGSIISGAVTGGEGEDVLILDGTSNALTNLQTMTAVQNFETLSVAAGYWVANSQGAASVFDSVSIAQGATLDVREVSIGGGPASTILTEAVENNGLLILNFNSDELADIEVLDITGTGDVRLDGEANFVLDQAIMAFTGKAIVANGSLTLAGTGGLSGDVETSGDGTFVLGDGGTTGSFAGNLVNNGRFIFNRTDDYSFLGDFSGTGSFTKKGAGVLTFAGDYSYTGTTVIEGGRVKFLGDIDPETEIELEEGTFDISDKPQTVAQLSGTQDSAINVNNSQLTVNQTSNTSYAGAITGDGAIVKSGTGTLNLTGNSTYTGPTTVNGGALAVNGSIVSTVTVNDGGTLKGNGTVGGATVTSNGTVAPGNSIGTLRVAGDVTFAAGSTYEVEVNADGRSDQILATGRAIIQGGTVAVVAEAGTYRPFTEYLIIGADGGVTGTFNNVTSNFAYLTPTLTYGTNAVRLQLLRNDIDFAAVTVTDNQASTANAVESLGVQNDLYGDIAVLTEAGARTAFDALSGEAYASIGSGILANGRLVADALLGAADTGGTGVWAQALGDWGSFDAAPGVAGLDSDHQGVIGGVNYGMNGFSIGAAFGASKSDYDVRGRASQADVDTKVAGVHAGYGAGPVTARIGGSYAWHDIDASRSIVFPTFSEDADAAYDATTMQLFGEVGYKVPVDAAVIEPFARIEHLRLKTDGFAEDGDTAALSIDEQTRKLQFLSLGVRATGSAPVSSTLTLEPQLSAAWRRGWGDLEGRSSAAFDGGDAFDIVGAALPKNALDLDVGVGLRSGNVRVGVSYRGILSNQWNSDGGQVSIGFTF